MPRISAGLLMYRIHEGKLQVLLAHPGGPRFENKDEKAWSIPKGEVEPGEDLLETAKREFEEETGCHPKGQFVPLTPVQQKGGKIVHAWAFEGDCDPRAAISNTIKMEWPPGSGRQIEFPECDRAEFFRVELAKRKIKVGQEGLIEELAQKVKQQPRNQSGDGCRQLELLQPQSDRDDTMTVDDFRKLALSLPEAMESAHMGHPDFRVRDKIFATIWPDEGWGMVKLTPDQQARFRQAEPAVFVPVKGSWGRKGATNVRLESANPATVRSALVTAWRNIAPKKLAKTLEEDDS